MTLRLRVLHWLLECSSKMHSSLPRGNLHDHIHTFYQLPPFPSLPFPVLLPLLVLPGVTSQINLLNSNPHLGVCFEGSPN